jgi:hypothetical protein
MPGGADWLLSRFYPLTRVPATTLGNARLRKALWMVVLQLIRPNAWLRQYYELPTRQQESSPFRMV